MNELTNPGFHGAYTWEVLDEGPGAQNSPRHFFPGNTAGGQNGLLVQVTPAGGAPWLGMFAFGNAKGAGVSSVLAMPDPEKLCVVSRGAGYLVTARDPSAWEAVQVMPVTDVRAVPSAGVVVFADFTEMVAYGAEGLRWRTKRLSWDGLKIIQVTERSIIGEYWDMRTEMMQTFEVDLATGAQKGGVDE
ncbi:hypothetical protein D7X30_20935 [Corallococcus sp. AB011P]|uniref:hypothetical protein n=1 Tax=Corallococcus sp. AB011P TaxID=2316735 RepID=UPI000EA25B1D|nr:hypothetical protein [Corallococcus sp. AB011P]RKG57205.1 hypothetical protein D7X30_20935 [Corallococcus sp. AB011P]